MTFPIPIDQVISMCVGNISQRILPELIAAGGVDSKGNDRIQALSFMFGHPLELKNLIKEMSEGKTTRYYKFPVVMLFADVITSPSTVRGCYGDVTLNMVIAMSTEQGYKTSERITKNFIPILRPIYQELIREIYRCGYFWVQTPKQILGNDTERFYWGTSGLQGNKDRNFDDFIDAIEIKAMKLSQSRSADSFTQNTFMQLVSYFLDQTRAEIVVGVDSATITNDFFKQPIISIVADTQTYVIGINFSQDISTGSITGIGISFYNGQTIIANR